jgi:hypothetical protein
VYFRAECGVLRLIAGGMTADFCVKNYILQWGMEDMQVGRAD